MSYSKIAGKTGVISIAIGGITASFGAADIKEFLDLITEYGPLLLYLVLLYVIYKLESKHSNCIDEQQELGKRIDSLNRELLDISRNCFNCRLDKAREAHNSERARD